MKKNHRETPTLTDDDKQTLKTAMRSRPMELDFEIAWTSWDVERLPLGSVELAEIVIAFKLSRLTRDRNQIDRIVRSWRLFDPARWDKKGCVYTHGEIIIRMAIEMSEGCSVPRENGLEDIPEEGSKNV
jgi:hypothetical protein